MKNQYFGDINDYRKYGLLRALAGDGEMKIAICWMLTSNDGGRDGGTRKYLCPEHKQRWAKFDCGLYKSLQQRSDKGSVQWLEQQGLISNATYFSELLDDDPERRIAYFDRFHAAAVGCDLAFFDPDNGIEVESTAWGGADSHKFIYWREIRETFASGKSLLVYQHFPRIKRDEYIAQLASKVQEKIHAPVVYSLRTAYVLFLLIPQPDHKDQLLSKLEAYVRHWHEKGQRGNRATLGCHLA